MGPDERRAKSPSSYTQVEEGKSPRNTKERHDERNNESEEDS